MNRLSQQVASSEQTNAINNLKDKTQGLSYENNIAGLSGPSGGFLSGKKKAVSWDAQGNVVIEGKVTFSGADLQTTLDGKQPKGDYVVTPTFNTYKANVVQALQKLQPKGDYAVKSDVSKLSESVKGDFVRVRGDVMKVNESLKGYQPKGDYASKGDINKLSDSLKGYQPKGEYMLANAGPFLKKSDLDTYAKTADSRFVSNQELKNFAKQTDTRFISNEELKKQLGTLQPKGNYMLANAGPFLKKSDLDTYAKTADSRFVSNQELKDFAKQTDTRFVSNTELKTRLDKLLFQPKGDYALKNELAAFQPKGDYALKKDIPNISALQNSVNAISKVNLQELANKINSTNPANFLLKSEVDKYIKAGPPGPAGKDGIQGPPGKEGPRGPSGGPIFNKPDGFENPSVQIGATNDAKDTNIYSLSFGKAEGGTYTGMGLVPNNKKAFPNTTGPVLGTHIKAQNEFGIFSDGWDKLFAVQGASGNVKIKGSLDASGRNILGELDELKRRPVGSGGMDYNKQVDFVLGKDIAPERGPVGPARALVRDGGSALTINYADDFVGGVNINARGGLRVGGNANITGTFGAGKFGVNNDDNGLTIRANAPAGKGRMHVTSEDELYVLNKKGMIVGKEWGGSGNLNVQGTLDAGAANFKGGVSAHNPEKWNTHFPWAGDNKNYIRGDTELRGNLNNIGDIDVGGKLRVGGKEITSGGGGAAFDGAMNDKQLRLRSAGDGNHYIAYTGAVDGARVQGHGGGQLGTNRGGDKTALTWNADGDISVTRNVIVGDNVIMGGKNSWILHTPDDGRRQLYVAPGTDGGNWDWSKQTQFMADGNVLIAGRNILGEIDALKNKPAGGAGSVDFDAFTNGNDAKFSPGWQVGGDWPWDPVIRGEKRGGYAHTEKKDGRNADWDDNITTDRTADITVPAGMKTGFLFHLPWSNCRYFDIWGLLGNGKEVFIRRVNAYQNVRNASTDNLHDAAAIVPIPRVDRFAAIRLKGVRGRIHYMGTGWSKSAIAASGADSGFVASQNIMGSALAIGDIPAPLDWTGANFRRRDGRWTHFDWKDDQRNYIRGDTVVDGRIIANGRTCRNASTGWNDEGGGNAVFLDRHNVECADDEILTKFKLNRNGKGQYQYDYRCCKL